MKAPGASAAPHILIVHQFYLMPGQPGGLRFNEFARFWHAQGAEVTVLAGALNYATGETPPKYRGRLVTREVEAGVTIFRCYVPGTYNRSYLGRMWAFFGFGLSSVWAALQAARPDVVIATSPPLTVILTGFIAAKFRLRPAKWVFEVRDLWPESAVTTGVLREKQFLARILYRLERWGYRHADLINVLTPAFRDNIVRRGLAPEGKICLVPNGADEELFFPDAAEGAMREALGWKDKFVVLYSGAHGRANALGQLLDAAAILGEEKDILIALVGDGPERSRLEREVKERRLTNVVFYGPQPKERMPVFVNACDVGAAVLQDNPTFRTVYPNKVFDYMACSKPVLLAIDGAAREMVCEDAKAGIFAAPENPTALAGAILQLRAQPQVRAQMGRSGRAWVLAHATRKALAQEYYQHLVSLAHSIG